MSSFTFSSVADLWPVGTSVSAYLPAPSPGTGSITSGSAVATASVASDGSLTFATLADDTAYVATDGTRARKFRTSPLLVGNDSINALNGYVSSQLSSTSVLLDGARLIAAAEDTGKAIYLPGVSGGMSYQFAKNTLLNIADSTFAYRFVGDKGRSKIVLPSGMSNGEYVLRRNRNSDGSGISNAYGQHPRLVFRDLLVDGGSSPNGSFLDVYRSSISMERVSFTGLLNGVVVDGYNDMKRLISIYAENMTSGGWVFKQIYPGDGMVVENFMAYASAGLSITKCQGGSIRGLVSGWHEFIECDLELSGVHLEGDGMSAGNASPLISCQGSRLYLPSGVLYCSSVRPALEISDNNGTSRRHSSVTINRELYFQQRLDDPGSTVGDRQGVAVNIKQPAKETELKMRGVRCRVFKQNATVSDASYELVAPIISTPNSTTDEQNLLTVLNSRKPLWAMDVEVRYRNAAWEVDAPEPMAAMRTTRRATSPMSVIATAANPMTAGWTNLAAGTYYYKAYTLDAENRTTAVITEVSATIDGTNPVPKLAINAYIAPCRLRILRGTVSGTYTSWVEIVLAKETAEFYDQGDAIAGQAWSGSGLPTPPTVNSTYNGWVQRGANAVIFGTTPPTDASWTQGDVMWNTGAAAAGSPGWICTASGTPGTWKAMAAVAA